MYLKVLDWVYSRWRSYIKIFRDQVQQYKGQCQRQYTCMYTHCGWSYDRYTFLIGCFYQLSGEVLRNSFCYYSYCSYLSRWKIWHYNSNHHYYYKIMAILSCFFPFHTSVVCVTDSRHMNSWPITEDSYWINIGYNK